MTRSQVSAWQSRVRLAAATTLAVAATAASLATATPALASPTTSDQSGQVVKVAGADQIPGEYIVVFKDQRQSRAASAGKADAKARAYGGKIKHRYGTALDGYAATMTPQQAAKLAADPEVARVQQSYRVAITDEKQTNPPSWGTDRVDQNNLPLDDSYTYPSNGGQGAHVYVLDTGIRKSHTDFAGRVSTGVDMVDNDNDPADCHGHGTHVAGTAAGTKYGLAKKATIHSVRVLDCQGSGSNSDIMAGIDWVKQNAVRPAVVNYSIGCQARCSDDTMDNAVQSLINSGVQWVQAAGNSNDDACYYSPQALPAAVTVGNSTSSDTKSGTSNYGSCLDTWAPGTNIVSASYSSDTGSATMTGTSMASPHVAGAAALYLGEHPDASPQQVRDALVNNASSGKLSGIGSGSPNKLLYTGFMNGGTDPAPGDITVINPGNQSGTVGTAVNLTIRASGGTAPYQFTATGLPAGTTINSSTGAITGTPTTAATNNVKITVTDSADKTGTSSFTWTITSGGDPDPGECSGEVTKRGTLSSGQQVALPAFTDSDAGVLNICLDGPDGSDFDIYLQKYSGGYWTTVASGATEASDETIRYTNTAGTYRIVVDAYSGSGSYTVGINE